MCNCKKGDIVARKSYGYDMLFKVADIIKKDDGSVNAILQGLYQRLEVDAPLEDLELQPKSRVAEDRKRQITQYI